MKRFFAILLALALLAAPLECLAATHADGATLAVRDNDFSVFVGWSNYPYRSDSVAPLVEMPVRSVLYGDMTRLVFTTVDEENQHAFAQGASILWQLNLTEADATPKAIAWIIGDAVGVESDAVIYYVDQSNANALVGYLPYQGYFQTAVEFNSPIEAIVQSVDGIYAFLEDKTYLYHPGTGVANDATSSTPDSANAIQAYAAFETVLDGAGMLSMRLKGQDELVPIDMGVQAVTAAAGMVYYLRKSDSGATLMAYNYGEGGSRELGEFREAMYPQLVSDGTSTVYAIGSSHEIYRYDALSGVLEPFANVGAAVAMPTLCYSAPDLLIYDEGTNSGTAEFVSAVQAQAQPVAELPTQVIQGTPLISSTNAPAPAATAAPAPEPNYPDMCKGSRGEDVKALQQLLDDYGYPAGKADGIFGANTVNAVKYLQCDLGQDQTGKVSHAALVWLQQHRNEIPEFDPYVLVKSGDRNYRVAVMQSRLKALNWLGGKADGVFGKSTRTAVANFQKAAGLDADGIAGAHTLKKLFSDGAPKYTPPAAPAKPSGNTKSREGTQNTPYNMDDSVLVDMVRWMNNNVDPSNFGWSGYDLAHAVYVVQMRLVQLGYMKKKQVTKVYDETTWLAVKHFQNDNDILPHPSGEPDSKTLQAMFPSTSSRMAMR